MGLQHKPILTLGLLLLSTGPEEFQSLFSHSEKSLLTQIIETANALTKDIQEFTASQNRQHEAFLISFPALQTKVHYQCHQVSEVVAEQRDIVPLPIPILNLSTIVSSGFENPCGTVSTPPSLHAIAVSSSGSKLGFASIFFAPDMVLSSYFGFEMFARKDVCKLERMAVNTIPATTLQHPIHVFDPGGTVIDGYHSAVRRLHHHRMSQKFPFPMGFSSLSCPYVSNSVLPSPCTSSAPPSRACSSSAFPWRPPPSSALPQSSVRSIVDPPKQWFAAPYIIPFLPSLWTDVGWTLYFRQRFPILLQWLLPPDPPPPPWLPGVTWRMEPPNTFRVPNGMHESIARSCSVGFVRDLALVMVLDLFHPGFHSNHLFLIFDLEDKISFGDMGNDSDGPPTQANSNIRPFIAVNKPRRVPKPLHIIEIMLNNLAITVIGSYYFTVLISGLRKLSSYPNY